MATSRFNDIPNGVISCGTTINLSRNLERKNKDPIIYSVDSCTAQGVVGRILS